MVKCIIRGKICELGGSKVRDDNDFLIFDGEEVYFSECVDERNHYKEQELENVAGNTKVIEDEFDSKATDHSEFIVVDGRENYNSDFDDERYHYTEKEFEDVVRNTKVVEDEFDENGRPKLKIVYIHPMDWSTKALNMIRHYSEVFMDAEMDADFRSRVIFVQQDKDYWPGTESDPDAMARREAKERTLRETGRRPIGGTPDYKMVHLPSYDVYDVDDGAHWDEDIHGLSRREYNRYFNSDLPGYKFLVENIPESGRMRWKESVDLYLPRKQQHSSLESCSGMGTMVKKQRQN